MAERAVISNLLSLGAELLPAVTASAQAPSSSSSPPPAETHQIEADLKRLMEMLERIKATLYDAEEREARERSVKLWLKELKRVVYDAEDVLGEYHYEVLRAQVEGGDASPSKSRKRKQVQIPDGMFDQIKQIKARFDEIYKDRIALRLSDEDGPRHCNSELQIAPTSHFVVESGIFGREGEKEELIGLLSSECQDLSVVAIVGTGGLGKTTLAQLVYNDQRIRERFDKFVWVCVSEDFNVQRLTRELVESITESNCDVTNLSFLQNKISEEIRGKRVLLVLDDVWNDNRSHWESFRTPFMSATLVKILVTTRNEAVSRIMQTMPTFKLDYLSEEYCWQLFQCFAFGEVNQKVGTKLVEIGKQIMQKCGMLPLAVKSIASLLRHQVGEENWREILECELWESDASDEIFRPLEISYARLPTYLKPCFLYCSMFPKDYRYSVEELVQLWISHGYIESNGKKNLEMIGRKYVKQLWERSFFEGRYEEKKFHLAVFKLHDMVHDLARLNLENQCYSIEAGKIPDIPKELYHLYVGNHVVLEEPLPSSKFTALRTLVMVGDVNSFFGIFDFSMAKKLRALKMEDLNYELEAHFSIVHLKHLRYLSLGSNYLERLPECICSFYSLKNLTLRCYDLRELPESIENLISLEELVIEDCHKLKVLPMSLCQLKALTKLVFLRCKKLRELPNDIGSLTNLRTLKISLPNSVSYLPPSLSEIKGIKKLLVRLKCKTIGWLKEFVDLKGTLCLTGLNYMPSLTDVLNDNLVSMHNLECLKLCFWKVGSELPNDWSGNDVLLHIKSKKNTVLDEKNAFPLMDRLQPHHNLRKLFIGYYGGITFPNWIANPTSCASLETIVLEGCKNLTIIQFGSLCKLKCLVINWCRSLRFLTAESLPLELQELEIGHCRKLKSMPGIQNLKSLVKLCIVDCENLHLLVTDTKPSVQLTRCIDESSCQNSLLGLKNLTSLRSLQIKDCPNLKLLEGELLPVESCKVEVSFCLGLKEWCIRHGITYKDDKEPEPEPKSDLVSDSDSEFEFEFESD